MAPSAIGRLACGEAERADGAFGVGDGERREGADRVSLDAHVARAGVQALAAALRTWRARW